MRTSSGQPRESIASGCRAARYAAGSRALRAPAGTPRCRRGAPSTGRGRCGPARHAPRDPPRTLRRASSCRRLPRRRRRPSGLCPGAPVRTPDGAPRVRSRGQRDSCLSRGGVASPRPRKGRLRCWSRGRAPAGTSPRWPRASAVDPSGVIRRSTDRIARGTSGLRSDGGSGVSQSSELSVPSWEAAMKGCRPVTSS